MADRVNTKFVILLITVLVVITLGVTGAVMIITSPQRAVARGDEFAAQGQFDAAAEQYGKALKKLGTDVGLLQKYADSLEKVQTNDPKVATQFIMSWLGAVREMVTRDPADEARFEALMTGYRKLAAELGQFTGWNEMFDRSQATLSIMPQMVAARRYRGIAQVNRMVRAGLSTAEREAAREDLTAALQAEPGHPDASYFLALWYLQEAQELDKPGQDVNRTKAYRQEADRLSQASLQAGPNDPRRIVDRIEILRNLKGDPDEIERLTEAAQQALSQNPHQVSVAQRLVSQLMTQYIAQRPKEVDPKTQGGGGDALLQRAEAILKETAQANPDNPVLTFHLGSVLELQGRRDEAMKVYKQAYDLNVEAPLFECVMGQRYQIQAGVQYVDLLVTQADSKPAQERETALTEAEELIKEIQASQGDSPLVNLELGRIAMVRGQWREAAEKLEQANEQFAGSRPIVLRLLGEAWDRAGETGVAAERLERFVELQPASLDARYNLVKIYTRLGTLDKAQRHMDLLLKAKGNDQKVQMLHAVLLAASGELNHAIDLCQSLDPAKNRDVALQLAGLYLTNNQRQEAAKLLETQLAANPRDMEVVKRLVGLQLGPQQTLKYIETARQAGADPKALDLLQRLTQGDNQQQLIEEVIEQGDDPLQVALRKYEIYRGMGKEAEAAQQLQEAVNLNPDHPRVIEAQFRQALTDKNWDLAETIANRAAATDADRAGGKFYFGRLAEAQGQLQRAADQYQAGLKTRPIFSDGWRMQGAAQLKLGRLNEAVDSLKKSLDQQPRNVAAMQLLAVAQERLGQYQDALETLRRAVRSPHSQTLWEQYLSFEQKYGDPATVLMLRKKMVDANPKDADARRSYAQTLAQQGQLDQAKAIVESLLQEEANDRDTIGLAAMIRRATGDSEGGRKLIQDYVHALSDQATSMDWIMLARYLLSIGQNDHALAAYRQAATVAEPNDHSASLELAQVMFAQQRFEDAAQIYHQVITDDPNDKSAALRYVESLLAADQLDQSQQAITQIVERDGHSVETYLLQARIEEAYGRNDQAIDTLTQAIKLAPRRAIVYFQRGRVEAGDAAQEAEAIADLKKAIELDAEMTAARMLLAQIHERRSEVQDAVGQLRAAIDADPNDKLARLHLTQLYMRTDQGIPLRVLLEESVKMFPEDRGWLQLQAQRAIQEKKPAVAVEKLDLVFQKQPTAPNLKNLVAAQLRAGKNQDALARLDQQKDIVEKEPILVSLRSHVHAALGRPDTAKADFEAAVRASRSLVEMMEVRAQAAPALGDQEVDAILARVGKEPAGVLAELALAQLEAIRNNYDAAIARLDGLTGRLTQDSPVRLDSNRLRAAVLYQVGRLSEAEVVYQEVLRQWPDDLMMLNNYGYMLSEEPGREQEGLALAKRAVELAPTNSLVLDTYGWSLLKNGQTDRAVGMLRRSVDIEPTATNTLHLAEALMAARDEASALRVFRRAKELAEKSQDLEVLEMVNTRLSQMNQALNGAMQ